jgi:integrase
LGGIAQDYLSSPRGSEFKESYRKSIMGFLDRDLVIFKDRPVSLIDKSEILAWYKRGANKPTATDNAFRVLHTLFEYAIALEYVTINPCKLVKNTGRYKKTRRQGHLSPDNTEVGEFAWAIATYEPPQDKKNFITSRDAIVLMFVSGLRSSEVMQLKWEDVNFQRKNILFKDTKNRRDHLIPMSRLMYAMLKKRDANRHALGKTLPGRAASEYVFPNRLGTGPLKDVRKTRQGILRQASLPSLTNHDLRRTFVTICEQIGIEEAIYKKMINHHTGVTGGYVQTSQSTLLENFERVSTYISLSMPVFIDGELQDRGAGERDNFMNLLYGSPEDIAFTPSNSATNNHYAGIDT